MQKPNFILLASEVRNYELVKVLAQDVNHAGRFITELPDGGCLSVAGEFLLPIQEDALATHMMGVWEAYGIEKCKPVSSREVLEELQAQHEYLADVLATI